MWRIEKRRRGGVGGFLSPTSLKVFCGEMLYFERQQLCVDT